MVSIKYLSDTDTDFKCLEDYLRNGDFGELKDLEVYTQMLNSDKLRPFYQSVSDKTGLKDEKIEELLSSQTVILPTRFEVPPVYLIVSMLIEQIKTAANDIGINTANFPYHSSIPTGLVNAQAVKLPCSKHTFLLFDSQIFHYCNLFAKAFALCIPLKQKGEITTFDFSLEGVVANIDADPECIRRLSDLLTATHLGGAPGRAEPYIPSMDYLQLASLFREGMELFLVGHEFGHIYAEHLGELIAFESRSAKIGKTVSKEHIQEFEADAIGMVLMCHAQAKKGYDAALSYIGAELFFHALLLEDRFAFLLRHGTDATFVSSASESHPSHAQRRACLRMHLPLLVENQEMVESITKFADQYSEIVEIIWQKIENLNK